MSKDAATVIYLVFLTEKPTEQWGDLTCNPPKKWADWSPDSIVDRKVDVVPNFAIETSTGECQCINRRFVLRCGAIHFPDDTESDEDDEEDEPCQGWLRLVWNAPGISKQKGSGPGMVEICCDGLEPFRLWDGNQNVDPTVLDHKSGYKPLTNKFWLFQKASFCGKRYVFDTINCIRRPDGKTPQLIEESFSFPSLSGAQRLLASHYHQHLKVKFMYFHIMLKQREDMEIKLEEYQNRCQSLEHDLGECKKKSDGYRELLQEAKTECQGHMDDLAEEKKICEILKNESYDLLVQNEGLSMKAIEVEELAHKCGNLRQRVADLSELLKSARKDKRLVQDRTEVRCAELQDRVVDLEVKLGLGS